MAITSEEINAFILNGGSIRFIPRGRLKEINPDTVEKYVSQGTGSIVPLWDSLIYVRKSDIATRMRKGHDLGFAPSGSIARREISDYYYDLWETDPHIVEKYVAKGGDLYYVPRGILSELSPKVVEERMKNGHDLDGLNWGYSEKMEKIDPEVIDQYVASGAGDLWELPDKIRENISEPVLLQRAKNCGDLRNVPEDKLKKIDKKIIMQYYEQGKEKNLRPDLIEQKITAKDAEIIAKMGGSLSGIKKEIIEGLSEDAIKAFAVKGKDLRDLASWQRDIIGKDLAEQRLKNGLSPIGLSESALKEISQAAVNEAASLGVFMDTLKEFLPEQAANIPKDIYEVSPEMQEAVVKFGAGTLSWKQLPPTLLANQRTRAALFDILQQQRMSQMMDYCKQNGGKVGPEEIKAFDKAMDNLKNEFNTKRHEYFMEQEKMEKQENQIRLDRISEFGKL